MKISIRHNYLAFLHILVVFTLLLTLAVSPGQAETVDSMSLTSDMFQTALLAWDDSKDNLMLAYFSKKLSDEERKAFLDLPFSAWKQALRVSRADRPVPDIYARFKIKKGVAAGSIDSVESLYLKFIAKKNGVVHFVDEASVERTLKGQALAACLKKLLGHILPGGEIAITLNGQFKNSQYSSQNPYKIKMNISSVSTIDKFVG